MAKVLNEADLEGFRREQLSPEAILRQVTANHQVLLRLPVGVGKSYAAHQFVLDKQVRERFDLIVYGAPRIELLDELAAKLNGAGVRHRILKRRPAERCGPLDKEWRRLENAACGALGRRKLCRGQCPHVNDCEWPSQLSELKGTEVILTSEQRLGHQRDLSNLLTEITGAERVLIVLDEGELAGMPFEVVVTLPELDGFKEAVESVDATTPEDQVKKRALLEACVRVQDAIERETTSGLVFDSIDTTWESEAVQEAGFEGNADFRFLGFDLELLRGADPKERYIEYYRLRFIARPKLDGPLLVLSANLNDEYFAHRLGLAAIASPFKEYRFMHSGSTLINIQSAVGTSYSFCRNHKGVLRHFAAILALNILQGTSTLLVSKKSHVETCKEALETMLAEIGIHVRIVSCGDWGELPRVPDPRIVPILHYGMVGTNSFEQYESALCLNGFYTRKRIIEKALQEADPIRGRVPMELETPAGRQRRVVPKVYTEKSGTLTYLGAIYLHKLEIDPVIQAVGRVRPMTKPRTVVMFAQHDLSQDLPGVQAVKTQEEARALLGVPSLSEIRRFREALQVEGMLAEGMTYKAAGKALGFCRETAHRRMEHLKSGKFVNSYSIALFATPGGPESVTSGRPTEAR